MRIRRDVFHSTGSGGRAGRLALLLVAAFASVAAATVPDRINFQGRLLDQNKLPRTGTFTMDFNICDQQAPGGNCAIWTETQSVDVTNGVFAVQLGAVTSMGASVFTSSARYLEVVVAGETLSPRERLITSPFAFRSTVSEGVVGLTASRAVFSDSSGNLVVSATVDDTELGYLNGVTSAIQTQFSGKENTITGAATTITASNLSAGMVLVSDGSGKV
ncbi:MAG: hypothetical protein HY925_02105, partial [Elusimicrobia bacterium]|nr:hypothetical protein [Elusimicrobiota bacterium]